MSIRTLQVSINMLRYGLGRSQSVPLQLGLAAAIRAAATASPATAVAAVDFMRYTESHLAEALAERHNSSADRCTLGQYSTGQCTAMLVRSALLVREAFELLGSDCTTVRFLCSRFISLEESPRLYAGLLTTRDGPDPWSVVAAAADGMAGILRRAQVSKHFTSTCATSSKPSRDAVLGRISCVVLTQRLHLPRSTRWPILQLANLRARGQRASLSPCCTKRSSTPS
jgi:hypothetical protein